MPGIRFAGRAIYAGCGKLVNSIIKPFGIEVRQTERERLKPWDVGFAALIEEAKLTGEDPNDVLNRHEGRWEDNENVFFSAYLEPLLKPGMTMLEIGPGTGRYTRRVIPFCREIYLVDYSRYLCTYLGERFRDHEGVHIVHTEGREALPIPDNSVDFAFSLSAFVHMYLETIHWYLAQLHRIVRAEGVVLINYDSMMDKDGYDWFKEGLPENPVKKRSIFRFYHPAQLEKIAESLEYKVDYNITHENQRGYSFLKLVKP